MIIIGHRGARGLAPENTLASFDAAIAAGVDYVEFDVRLTRDKQLVVIHDRHTKRIAFVKQHIRQLTLEEVKALATRDGIPVPTLEEVLRHLKRKVKLNIEVKASGTAGPLWEIIKPLLDNKTLELSELIISSSRLGELKALRKRHAELRLALLQRRFPLRFLFVPSNLQLYGVGFKHLLVMPFIVRLARQRKLFTYAYTVNKPARAAQLVRWGIQGICTDRPDIVK